MGLILTPDICKEIRERWIACVPIILELAKEEKTASVAKILKSYRPVDLENDFGNR